MLEMVMIIVLVYSASGIAYGKYLLRPQNGSHFDKVKYLTKFQFDICYDKFIANYARKIIFHGDYVIDDVTGWPQSFPLYSCFHIYIFSSGKISINKTFQDRRSKVKVTGLLGDLGT